MKKGKYGSVLRMCWNQYFDYKNRFPYASAADIYTVIHDKYEAALKRDPDNGSKMISLRAWELWLSDYKKEFLHVFFLDKKLKEVLENMKIKVDSVKEFVQENGTKEIMWSDTYHGNIEVSVYCFAVRIPDEEYSYAFKFMLYDNHLITICCKDDTGGFEITDDAYQYFLKSKEDNAKLKVKAFQLCINTIMYMDCYPECIVDGIPEDMDANSYPEKTCKLSASEDIKEIIRSGGEKSPYIKGTYFMTFRDERYTKMRGKTIRVKAKFIKGKAVTAKTAEDFSRMENI